MILFYRIAPVAFSGTALKSADRCSPCSDLHVWVRESWADYHRASTASCISCAGWSARTDTKVVVICLHLARSLPCSLVLRYSSTRSIVLRMNATRWRWTAGIVTSRVSAANCVSLLANRCRCSKISLHSFFNCISGSRLRSDELLLHLTLAHFPHNPDNLDLSTEVNPP